MHLKILNFLICVFFFLNAAPSQAIEKVEIKFSINQLHEYWRDRIQSFLDRGVIPIIDLESSLKRKDGEKYLKDLIPIMDELGIALIAFDGYQRPKGGEKSKGYRWGYYTNEIVNNYPDRFIPTTNGGTNKNWLKGKEGKKSFITQLERHVRSGDYSIIGELDFRHYMSKNQCKNLRIDRDSNVPIHGINGHRVFALSSETNTPFVIHHEPEDYAIHTLEKMIRRYPNANVIVAHFGQLRNPEKQKKFGPKLVRRLLGSYPNLFYELATGFPNRTYKCIDGDEIVDTVIWKIDEGRQSSSLSPAYKSIFEDFSNKFVAGTDYGGGRGSLPNYLRKKIKNHRLIVRDLSNPTKHNINYRNAWKLITGKKWVK